MKVTFVHPDLGIGGAERLIVDAALALQAKGHDIIIFTSYFDSQRCFSDISNGQITIKVVGKWIPRHIFGFGHVFMAILKSWILALYLVISKTDRPDVFFVDQVSASIPILRLTGSRVLFYCHFPDKLLTERQSLAKYIYRLPFDLLEEMTTKMAHVIVVNSTFTASVFNSSFKFIPKIPSVLYPGINLAKYDSSVDFTDISIKQLFLQEKGYILSINRFENKKNIDLAIGGFALLMNSEQKIKDTKLVIAGGYDSRVSENVTCMQDLQELVKKLGLTFRTWKSDQPNKSTLPIIKAGTENVLFVPSFTDSQRTFLLKNALFLVYSPSNEHFGIVPLEAMYSGLPVIACDSGGPRETVVDKVTGLLCESSDTAFAAAMKDLLVSRDAASKRKRFGTFGRKMVSEKFSLDIFANRLHDLIEKTFNTHNMDADLTFYVFWFAFINLVLLVASIFPIIF